MLRELDILVPTAGLPDSIRIPRLHASALLRARAVTAALPLLSRWKDFMIPTVTVDQGDDISLESLKTEAFAFVPAPKPSTSRSSFPAPMIFDV